MKKGKRKYRQRLRVTYRVFLARAKYRNNKNTKSGLQELSRTVSQKKQKSLAWHCQWQEWENKSCLAAINVCFHSGWTVLRPWKTTSSRVTSLGNPVSCLLLWVPGGKRKLGPSVSGSLAFQRSWNVLWAWHSRPSVLDPGGLSAVFHGENPAGTRTPKRLALLLSPVSLVSSSFQRPPRCLSHLPLDFTDKIAEPSTCFLFPSFAMGQGAEKRRKQAAAHSEQRRLAFVAARAVGELPEIVQVFGRPAGAKHARWISASRRRKVPRCSISVWMWKAQISRALGPYLVFGARAEGKEAKLEADHGPRLRAPPTWPVTGNATKARNEGTWRMRAKGRRGASRLQPRWESRLPDSWQDWRGPCGWDADPVVTEKDWDQDEAVVSISSNLRSSSICPLVSAVTCAEAERSSSVRTASWAKRNEKPWWNDIRRGPKKVCGEPVERRVFFCERETEMKGHLPGLSCQGQLPKIQIRSRDCRSWVERMVTRTQKLSLAWQVSYSARLSTPLCSGLGIWSGVFVFSSVPVLCAPLESD